MLTTFDPQNINFNPNNDQNNIQCFFKVMTNGYNFALAVPMQASAVEVTNLISKKLNLSEKNISFEINHSSDKALSDNDNYHLVSMKNAEEIDQKLSKPFVKILMQGPLTRIFLQNMK